MVALTWNTRRAVISGMGHCLRHEKAASGYSGNLCQRTLAGAIFCYKASLLTGIFKARQVLRVV